MICVGPAEGDSARIRCFVSNPALNNGFDALKITMRMRSNSATRSTITTAGALLPRVRIVAVSSPLAQLVSSR